jgi:hypothetical protein
MGADGLLKPTKSFFLKMTLLGFMVYGVTIFG